MRKIYCYKCQCFLGDIRDATLKKGVLFLCPVCFNKERTKDYDLPKGFEDLFGGIIWTVNRLVTGLGIMFKSKAEQEEWIKEGPRHTAEVAKSRADRAKENYLSRENTFQEMRSRAKISGPDTDDWQRSEDWLKIRDSALKEYERLEEKNIKAQKSLKEIEAGKTKPNLLEAAGFQDMTVGEKIGTAFGVFTPMMKRSCFGFISAALPIVFPKDRDIPVCIRSAPAPVGILFSLRM